jgi:mannose-6-phosphate isomerase-like protein (cupin superfamily)
MKVFTLPLKEKTGVQEIASFPTASKGRVVVGIANFQAGQQVPEVGESLHGSDEFAFLLRGKVRIHTPEGTYVVGAGEGSWVPMGTPHRAEILEDTSLIWVWIGREEEEG